MWIWLSFYLGQTATGWFQAANIWLILMVIIWLMMVNNHLVGGIPTPLKNDGVKVSWDDYSVPN